MRRTRGITRKALYLGATALASVLLLKPPLVEKAFAQEKQQSSQAGLSKTEKKKLIKEFKKAVSSGDAERVAELLNQLSSAIKGKTRINSLIIASRKGHAEIVELLLEDKTISINNETNKTEAIKSAACNGNLNVVKVILDAEGGMSKEGKTAALITASSHGHVEIVKLLVEAGADVNVYDTNSFYTKGSGWTPMVYAAKKGHVEVIEYFLEIGVDVDQGDAVGSTPLMTAAFYGKTDVVKFLLSKGADPNAASDNGMTPLIAAAGNGQLNIVKMLVAAGADVTAKSNSHEESGLYLSVEKDYWKVAKYLIKQGADVDVQTKYGVTPLMKAVGDGSKECTKILLANNADTNLKDEIGWTALIYAVRVIGEKIEEIPEEELESMEKPKKKLYLEKIENYETSMEIIQLLLSAKKNPIDINVADDEGKTALDHADNPEVRELLKKYGAK